MDLFSNVILTGGSTMFRRITDRLHSELKELAGPNMRIRINAPPERKNSVWIGGSIIASLPSFQRKLITRQQYEEHGPRIVYRSCL